MGLGSRIFLVNDDDSIKRLSMAKFERLNRGDPEERLPQYAGKRVRYVFVILEIDNRKPVDIVLVQHSHLPLDSEGRIDTLEMEKEVSLAMDIVPPLLPEKRSGRTIDARYKFARKRYFDQYKWTPSRELQRAIVEAIFGKGIC
jgi:hypothetical protein